MQSGYLKRLDLRFFFSLQTPGARRLYRFLDKKIHTKPRLEIDIFQLSQQLGMAYYRYPAKVKEKLQPGIDELIDRGYLASAEMVKVQGYTRMRFVKGSGPVKQVAPPDKESKPLGSSTTAETCGQYGCDARTWRKRMANEHKVSDEHLQLWETVLKSARKRISRPMYSLWLSRTLFTDLDVDQVTILAPNAFIVNGITGRYEGLLQEALAELLNTNVTLMYRTVSE
jgi:hypothetical protein